MSPLINTVVDNLMELMKKHGESQEPFNIHGWMIWVYYYRQHPKDEGRQCFQSVHTCGWVSPSCRWGGGTLFPVQDRGYPIARSGWEGVPHSKTGWGTPLPKTGWGTPLSGLDGVPCQARWVTPPLIQDWMGYPLPVRRQSSIASTCYAAGGMPLAFTQEDFLVSYPNETYHYLTESIFIEIGRGNKLEH